MLDFPTALDNFAHFDTPYCLIGHSHVQLSFELDETAEEILGSVCEPGEIITLGDNRLILNPGSVGQPRDGDPRAAFALLDEETMRWECGRVAYDIAAVQERMRALKFPARLINRLADGQ